MKAAEDDYTCLSPVLWQRSAHAGGQRYYLILQQWWTHAFPTLAPTLIVASISAYQDDERNEGHYACYIGHPPDSIWKRAQTVTFEMARWVAQNGIKLTAQEASGFPNPSPAPNDVPLHYRD